jgi:hypothetical protein
VAARVGECLAAGTPTINRAIERTMSTPTDYTKLATTLDYVALEKKLTQLAERQPPKKRKSIADVLEPLRERLLALHRKGWHSGQLSDELKAAGVPVSPARLRECLSLWTAGEGRTAKSRTRRRPKRAAANAQPTITASHAGRSSDSQTGLKLPAR